LDLARAARRLDADLVLDAVQQDYAGLVAGEPGNALKLLDVPLHGLVDLGVAALELLLAGRDGALAAVQALQLAVEVFFLLLEASFGLLQLAAPLAGLGLDVVAEFQRFVVGFEQDLVLARGGLGLDALGV